MGGDSSDPKIKVTPKEDGAVITVGGFDIEIKIKPSEEVPIVPPVARAQHFQSYSRKE